MDLYYKHNFSQCMDKLLIKRKSLEFTSTYYRIPQLNKEDPYLIVAIPKKFDDLTNMIDSLLRYNCTTYSPIIMKKYPVNIKAVYKYCKSCDKQRKLDIYAKGCKAYFYKKCICDSHLYYNIENANEKNVDFEQFDNAELFTFRSHYFPPYSDAYGLDIGISALDKMYHLNFFIIKSDENIRYKKLNIFNVKYQASTHDLNIEYFPNALVTGNKLFLEYDYTNKFYYNLEYNYPKNNILFLEQYSSEEEKESVYDEHHISVYKIKTDMEFETISKLEYIINNTNLERYCQCGYYHANEMDKYECKKCIDKEKIPYI